MAKIVYAKANYVRKSARKARLVIDMIKGMQVENAANSLKFSNKAIAVSINKVLKSAVSNASHNEGMDKANLFVKEAFINDAPIFKRGRAVSKGRYHQILKRNSHIVIGVSEKEAVKAVKKTEKLEKPKKTVKAESKIEKSPAKTEKKDKKDINLKKQK